MSEMGSRADGERTWFRTQSREWRTLAVVPTEPESSEPAFNMAKLIIELGAEHGEKLGLASFRDIPLQRVTAFLNIARAHVGVGERIVYATRSISENPGTVAVARASDCVLLCVSLGTTSIRAIEDVIDQIGRERFLGSVVFRPYSGKSVHPAGLIVRPPNDVEVRP